MFFLTSTSSDYYHVIFVFCKSVDYLLWSNFTLHCRGNSQFQRDTTSLLQNCLRRKREASKRLKIMLVFFDSFEIMHQDFVYFFVLWYLKLWLSGRGYAILNSIYVKSYLFHVINMYVSERVNMNNMLYSTADRSTSISPSKGKIYIHLRLCIMKGNHVVIQIDTDMPTLLLFHLLEVLFIIIVTTGLCSKME